MLKRFYSKRSGFTLVEIIVAFAVFAIMAAMIAQILNLAVSARRYNNEYANALAAQEKVLTVIEKSSDDYDDSGATGMLNFNFDGTTLPPVAYQTKSAADPRELTSAEGLNYFLSPVDYGGTDETPPIEAGGSTNGGSQMSRMDTRITGTGRFDFIKVCRVIKDEHTQSTDPNAANYLPAGHVRYFVQTCASANASKGFQDEDVPYAQYRLFFYSDKIDPAASSIVKTDADGKQYTEDVYEALTITKVGYLNGFVQNVASTGLTASNIGLGLNDSYNKYTVEQSGANGIRIGTPFVENNSNNGVSIAGSGNKGERFESSNYSNFYIEIAGDGDFELTPESFGYNGEADTIVSGGAVYSACPNYKEAYESDGTPKYTFDGDHVNIYGAYLYKRNYM